MSNAAAGQAIPVIDVGPLVRGERCPATALALRGASESPGFIYISNHGIADAVINRGRDAARGFFSQSDAAKSVVGISRHHRGWLSVGGARMTDDSPTDLKESFVWGHPHDAQQAGFDHSLRGPNQWPDVADFRQCATEWLDCAQRLARSLLRGVAASLDLPADFFLTTSDRPLSRASYVYYPRRPEGADDGRHGVGPHTDFGVLTILAQDEVGGLQIQNAQGDWVDAPPIDGTLVVNVGDLLARWTRGAFRSAPHRVVSPTVGDRLSLVLAYDPNPETLIDARDVFPDAPDSAEPITCGDYLDWRFSKAFAYREQGEGSGPATVE